MDYFVRKFLAQLRIMNATVANTKELDTEALFAIDAALRLPGKKFEETGWVTLPWLFQSFIFGILDRYLQNLVTLQVYLPRI